jgi:xylan 1,4-beta-xylosidase
MHHSRKLAALFLSLGLLQCRALPAQTAEQINVDSAAKTTPFPHFWEQTFGSGRAILSLRESYRNDLRTVKQATGFRQVRFHGILMDEVGLYDPNRVTKNPGLAAQAAHDASTYNFTYIDQIYDGLLDQGIRPYIELSFMPKAMASDPNALHPFWYHPNVSPPKNYADWDEMIHAFAAHLIARYGIDEVATWKFEVWNEPNLDFWAGNPKQQTYWEIYDHTARALKAVSSRLLVGGPSTAQAAWVDAFLAHAKSANVPVDFVSTHVYANDQAKDVFGTDESIPRDVMVYRSVKKVHDQIRRSAFPNLPLYFSEYNASYANEPNVTDTSYIGPWLANTIRLCDGIVQDMAYWTFSDVFEEQGVNHTPFYGGFGLIAASGIPKASLNVFRALHTLGDRRIAQTSQSALVTESDSAITIALWNYAPPTGTGADYTAPPARIGPDKTFSLNIAHVAPTATVEVLRVDAKHGDSNTAFDAMGRPPVDLTRDQIKTLQAAGAMASPEHRQLANGKIDIVVPAQGLVVLKITR